MPMISTNEDTSFAAVAGPNAVRRHGGTALNVAIGLSVQALKNPVVELH